MLRVMFQDCEYVFTGDDLDSSGALATLDDYENGRCSFAHLYEDGKIRRFSRVIGSRDDLMVVGETWPNTNLGSLLGILIDPSWPL